MSGFDDREKSFETKAKHDAEQEFKAVARRNKLLGLWAAELIGISGDAAHEYAKDVVMCDFDEPGDDDVLRKVSVDFKDKGVDISDHQLRAKMDALLVDARLEIASEM